MSLRPLAALLALASVAAAPPASARELDPYAAGRLLFEQAFDPERNFAGDIRPSSDDALLLTAVASARDDYVPEYSLAVAVRCIRVDDVSCRMRYSARLLRVPGGAEDGSSNAFALHRSVRQEGADILPDILAAARLEWLEADVGACPGGIEAMDKVRLADWRPDLHYSLQPVEQREIILHPAAMWVRVTGSYTTARWHGWRLSPGVPAAVTAFLETLEPCWRRTGEAPPWERRMSRRR